MPELLDLLASELERPRPVSPQIVKHLGDAHEVSRDMVGEFLVRELPRLEDYEVDLILSPAFTPSLDDQAVFAAKLGATSVPAEGWPELIRQLAARPTVGHLITDDESIHEVPLRDVVIERYVRRLRLDGTIPQSLLDLIEQCPPAGQPLLKAVARRAIWERAPRREMLARFLAAAAGGDYTDDAPGLLRLVETYEPADTADFLARIPQWQQMLRHDINLAGSPKPFFNERVQELHGGGRDQRVRETSRITAREAELALLERLAQVFAK